MWVRRQLYRRERKRPRPHDSQPPSGCPDGEKARTAFVRGGSQFMARLYGPAVRYKPDVNKWRVVLRFCIRPLHGAIVLLAIMDNGVL